MARSSKERFNISPITRIEDYLHNPHLEVILAMGDIMNRQENGPITLGKRLPILLKNPFLIFSLPPVNH